MSDAELQVRAACALFGFTLRIDDYEPLNKICITGKFWIYRRASWEEAIEVIQNPLSMRILQRDFQTCFKP